MSALGIILSAIHNETIDELTRKRTTASVPFGGKYRLIDFPLSNFVNAGINHVGVLTQKNYQSLMDHIGTGRDWDLARKNGGLIVFPPFSSVHSDFLYETRLEALKSIYGFISKANEDYVVLTDCDSVNVVNYDEVLAYHEKNNADITVVYKNMKADVDMKNHMALSLNGEGRIVDASLKSKIGEVQNVSLNIWVLNRKLLVNILSESFGTTNNSFNTYVIYNNLKALKIYGFEYKGIYLHPTTMENYYKSNMLLLNPEIQKELFSDEERKIYTKVRDSAPTRYGVNAVTSNSFIADGCEIEGTVINSILFRGVKVRKGTVIKNSIIMQDTIISSGAEIDHVIADKNVVINENVKLIGCDKIPFYIGKAQVL